MPKLKEFALTIKHIPVRKKLGTLALLLFVPLRTDGQCWATWGQLREVHVNRFFKHRLTSFSLK